MPFDRDLNSVLDDLLAAARKAGADSADASLSARESLSVDVRLGELEGVEHEEGRSVALRAMVGKRQAGATSTDLSPKALEALAERVVAMAKAAPEDPFCGLADPARLAKDFPVLDVEDDARPDARALEDLARACEDAARAVPGVTNSAGSGASFDTGAFAFATSDGFRGGGRGTTYGLGISPLAERDGLKERDWESRTVRFFNELPSAESIGRAAGERTVARLGAKKIPTQKAPVIFENRMTGRVIGSMLGAISGAAIARGVSYLKDKLGKQVFAPGVDIIDDPLLKRGLSSRPFDGEGVAVQTRKLVEDGVLTTWLLNTSAAKQLKMETTGHATRGHGGPPGIASSNITLKAGPEGTLDDLMKQAGTGLLVVELFSPSINSNTGDYSVGVAGFWFENGERQHAVSEVTVAGNLIDIYARLIPGGDRDRRGSLDAPSVLIDDLAIAGL